MVDARANARKAVLRRQEKKRLNEARDALGAIYEKKRADGLIDVRFDIALGDEAEKASVLKDVMSLEAAVERGDFKVISFNDRRDTANSPQ